MQLIGYMFVNFHHINPMSCKIYISHKLDLFLSNWKNIYQRSTCQRISFLKTKTVSSCIYKNHKQYFIFKVRHLHLQSDYICLNTPPNCTGQEEMPLINYKNIYSILWRESINPYFINNLYFAKLLSTIGIRPLTVFLLKNICQ